LQATDLARMRLSCFSERRSFNPAHSSLRAQTREGGLSTIEAVAFALDNLGEDKKISESLREYFRRLILGIA